MRSVVALFFLAAGCTKGSPPSSTVAPVDTCHQGLEVGDCAPDFQLLNADGTPISLADKVGERIVVVGSSLW